MSGQTHSVDTVKGIPTRSLSVPAIQPSVHQSKPSPLRNMSERAASIPASPQKSASPRDDTLSKDIPMLDLVSHLQRSESSVVKTRSGSVLTRGFILKTDHYPSGKSRIRMRQAMLRLIYTPIRPCIGSRSQCTWSSEF